MHAENYMGDGGPPHRHFDRAPAGKRIRRTAQGMCRNALVLRSDTEVTIRSPSAGAAAILSSIRIDVPAGEAAPSALAGVPDFDFGNSLVDLFGSGAVVGLSSPSAVLGTSAGRRANG